MSRSQILRIAHRGRGHSLVLGTTENCPGGREPGNPARWESRETWRAKDDRVRAGA